MKRMRPRVHLRVDERVSAARAEARDVDVMIDESVGIDVVERAFDEVGSFLTQGGCEILRLSREGAADVMDETHSCRTFSARSCVLLAFQGLRARFARPCPWLPSCRAFGPSDYHLAKPRQAPVGAGA